MPLSARPRFATRLAMITACVSAGLLAGEAAAQVRMTRIVADTGQVTLQNFGASSVDVASWQMCSGSSTYRSVGTLSPSGSTDLAPGESVEITYGLFVSTGDEVALYVSGPFTGGSGIANIRDYMQFKSTTGTREGIAVSAGLWGVDDAVSVDGPYVYTGDGTQNGVGFWEMEAPPAVPVLPAAGLALLAVALLGFAGRELATPSPSTARA